MLINPYYNPEKLGLDMYTLDDGTLSYEFDILCFWVTPAGTVYSAQDSGCSCPVPFEDYQGNNMRECTQLMERVPNLQAAIDLINEWNVPYDYKANKVPFNDIHACITWLEEKFK